MLASITPLGERGRNNTYLVTTAWHVVGAAALGAELATTVSATIGVAGLLAGGLLAPEAIASAWMLCWSGDAIGVLRRLLRKVRPTLVGHVVPS